MLRNRNVAVGKYYVNNARRIAREVLGIQVNIVTFNTPHLDTVNSCHSPSECTLRDFMHRADHEATSSEVSHLRYRQMEAALYAPQWTTAEEARPLAMNTAWRTSRGETILYYRSPSHEYVDKGEGESG